MYGYPGSIAIRHLLDEPFASAAPVRPTTPTASDRHPYRWLVAVVIAPLLLAAMVAGLLLTTSPAEAATASASYKAKPSVCYPTARWNGCTPWMVWMRTSAHEKRIFVYGGPYLPRTHAPAKRP
jgi:hypothetical protein